MVIVAKEEFDTLVDTNRAKIALIDEKLAGLQLERKDFLLRTIELADQINLCDKDLFREPLKDLFNCNDDVLETTVVVVDDATIKDQVALLEVEIEEIKGEINAQVVKQLNEEPSIDEEDDELPEEQDRSNTSTDEEGTGEEDGSIKELIREETESM